MPRSKKSQPLSIEELIKRRGITYTFVTTKATKEEIAKIPDGLNIQKDLRLTKDMVLKMHQFTIENNLSADEFIRIAIGEKIDGKFDTTKQDNELEEDNDWREGFTELYQFFLSIMKDGKSIITTKEAQKKWNAILSKRNKDLIDKLGEMVE